MKTMTAGEAREQIEREAQARAAQEVRCIPSIEIGRVVRQGDIYLHRVAGSHKHGDRAETQQLAIGNTQGSRHVAEAPAIVFVGTTAPKGVKHRVSDGRGGIAEIAALLGPCIVSLERFVVTHPEHAHISLPAGTYQVTHQLDAQTMTRVRD